jgi:hypothetical protein
VGTLPVVGITILFGGTKNGRDSRFESLVQGCRDAGHEVAVISQLFEEEKPHEWRRAILAAQKTSSDVIAIVPPCLSDPEAVKRLIFAMECGESILCISNTSSGGEVMAPFESYLMGHNDMSHYIHCLECN